MKQNRRTGALLAAAGLSAALLAGCGGAASKAPETPEEFRAAMIDRAVVSTGNTARLNTVLERAKGGSDITIAYIGGSITEGYAAGARSPQCYASLSAADFQSSYCQGGTVTCRNNGLSGTPSILGNLRVSEETLPAQPDIIFIEFAVNDGGEPDYTVSYESLVRTCLEAENNPAVILLFTYMENGHTCQDKQQEIGAHYDLGMISVRDAILPEMEAGRMAWSEYGDDDVHPSVAGHRLVADFIAKYFEKAAAKKPDSSYSVPAEAVHPGLFSGGALHDAANMTYKDGDWTPGTNNQRFQAGFVYQKGGGNAPLTFDLTAQTLFLVYKLSPDKAYGMAGVYVNGELAGVVNGYGANAWNGPAVTKIKDFGTETELHVEIRMLDDHTDRDFEIFAVGTANG